MRQRMAKLKKRRLVQRARKRNKERFLKILLGNRMRKDRRKQMSLLRRLSYLMKRKKKLRKRDLQLLSLLMLLKKLPIFKSNKKQRAYLTQQVTLN